MVGILDVHQKIQVAPKIEICIEVNKDCKYIGIFTKNFLDYKLKSKGVNYSHEEKVDSAYDNNGSVIILVPINDFETESYLSWLIIYKL